MTSLTDYETDLINKFSDINEKNYQTNILSMIRLWKIKKNSHYDYLVGNEALNWKRLAVQILTNINIKEKLLIEIYQWLSIPEIYSGMSEFEFRYLMGYEKYNSYLSYFYGVLIERSILCCVERENYKKRISNGKSTVNVLNVSYEHIYGYSFLHLYEEYCKKSSVSNEKQYEYDDENFTYYCFKKRIEDSEPAKLASDTKKGTIFLQELMRSEEKRLALSNNKVKYSKIY